MRILTAILLISLFSCAPSFVLASDVSVLVGVKAWFTNISVDDTDKTNGVTLKAESKSPSLLFGPAITLRYRELLMGISQSSGDFSGIPLEIKGDLGVGTGDVDYSRKETDINVAMSLNPNFSVVIGHKQLDDKATFKNQKVVFYDGSPTQYFPDESSSSTTKGNYIGVSAYTRPNPAGVVFFGNFAVSRLKDDSGTTADGNHYDVGLGYIPKNSPAYFSVSFRGQSYSYSDSSSDGTESYSGLNVTINYRF